ncbi:DNA-binding transcriptional LysR family regulator [Halopolyspora algeriensis]|uniref:DNA-binding transcriptional LysR family regulator n=1 Tax=Halopolyspora algeriensis TaxID=1500506 RepID=A0A368VXC6_9ACTN|nr:LysR substrate-binding domain-containing protein [Halopolyspora algeriensis]RCW45967.1 DNA-binding transcriptional LysR family regulator [Halopolyspora algeriensis]TQM55380.1 DNA-binding transcriptional LysR family regulator [Halopolyspora algeriensis]
MELRHLRYFVAVAETRHFGKAAERLHMAQPPLSQAIRQLEADLGAELFTRTTRRVQLTGAGEAFYDDALRILQSVDDSARRVKRIAEGSHGVLRLGLTGLASYRYLPEIAQVVKRDMPGVALEIHSEMLTPAQELALIGSTIDVGILRPPIREDGIAQRGIAREPLVLALPENHWLADEPTVNVGDLRIEHFIMYSAASRSVVNDAVVRSCLAAGFYPHREHEGAETSILLALVAAGLGVALVPDSVRAIALNGVVFKTVHGAESVELALAWRENDPSPLLRNLLSTLDNNNLFVTADAVEDVREDHQS